MEELKVSINFIDKILGGSDASPEAISELYEIHNGNKKVIYEHLITINNIISKAIKYLESKGAIDE